jgi:CD109 antigen
LYAGSISAVTLTTFDAKTRQPRLLTYSLALVSTDGSSRWWLGLGSTGRNGQARYEFSVPEAPSGSYKLQAFLSTLSEPVSVDTSITSTPAILIETDKPIYKPSQVIQGRVVLLDSTLRPRAGQVEITFHDAKGIRIARQKATIDRFGATAFSLPLAHELNLGTWKIRARSEGVESVRDVRVEHYTLPRFDLKADFEKSWALVDEPVRGSISARYFFGKDVQGKVSIRAKKWVGTWTEYARLDGSLSDGRWKFELPAVKFVAGTLENGGKGAVSIEISATDSTGQTQSITEALTIAEAPVVLNIIPRMKTLKPTLVAEFTITSQVPDGSPLSLPVDITSSFYSSGSVLLSQTTKTIVTTNGIGTLSLVPPAGSAYGEIRAQARVQGRTTASLVRVGSAYTPSGNFLSLTRTDAASTASVGQVVNFSVLSTEPGTVYYEVYAGGRTVLSDANENNSFSFAVTPEMMPRAKVVAYKITPNSEVTADSGSFDVALNISVSMAANFNAGQVKPGDPVEVTIDSGTGNRTLLGISIVDNSVLALGRSRLHLQQVFEDLERRFLEPQAQVTEVNLQLPPGPLPAANSVRTRGALDVLKEAGLSVGVSSGIAVPEGRVVFGGGVVPDIILSPPPAGPIGSPPVPDAPRLRQFFPETWVWQPLLLTDDSGKAKLKLEAPDSITSWKLAAVGTCPETSAKSGIGFGEAELTVFQDFFVEPSIPSSVIRGELFSIKVDIFNYLDREQTVTLTLDKPNGIELFGNGEVSVKVPANSASSAEFPIRPTSLGDLPLKITAAGSSRSDAVLRNLTVLPEGTPVEQVLNAVLRAGESAQVDPALSAVAVPGSGRASLHLTPSPVAQTMKGVSELLHMPFGCGEQNMIFLAPDVEILKYLRETGELAPEIRAKAENFINTGYQRQLTFQTKDGGFAAFGGDNGSLWLTAFVLSTFSGAREVRDIDETVLAKAAGMLVARQNADGSFRTDRFLIHTEMDGGIDNIYTLSAYVTNALADYGGKETAAALPKAALFLAQSRSIPAIAGSSYALAIAAVALQKVPGFESTAELIIERLLQQAILDKAGIHWEPYPVETTAYATMALLMSRDGKGRPEANAALEWLSTQRNALGGYGHSTQDTVVALRALFQAARRVRRDIYMDVELVQKGRTLHTFRIDPTNFDLLHEVDLPVGEGTLTLRASGSGSVVYQVISRFNVPGSFLPPPRDLLLDVSYDTSRIESDNTVDVNVRLAYTGLKSRTAMIIADVGVPTGFEAVRASLDALTEQKTVQRIEVAGRKVIFYIDGLARTQTMAFSFQIKSLYPVRAEATVSKAYDYYDSSVQAYHRERPLSIGMGRSRNRP